MGDRPLPQDRWVREQPLLERGQSCGPRWGPAGGRAMCPGKWREGRFLLTDHVPEDPGKGSEVQRARGLGYAGHREGDGGPSLKPRLLPWPASSGWEDTRVL